MSATDGPTLLGEHVRRHGAAEISRRLHVSEAAVRAWSKRQRKPARRAREDMASTLDIPVESTWGNAPPTPPQDAPEPAEAPQPAVPSPPPLAAAQDDDEDEAPPPPNDLATADARRVAQETVERLRKELDRLDTDPETTSRERAQVATALTSAIRIYARVSGALEITPRMICSSPHWASIVATLTEALAPFPEAASAAAVALTKIEGIT